MDQPIQDEFGCSIITKLIDSMLLNKISSIEFACSGDSEIPDVLVGVGSLGDSILCPSSGIFGMINIPTFSLDDCID
jgi:hypothetical protein